MVLDHQGVDETLIGLNAGTYFIAVFAVAPLATRLLRARGPAVLMLVSILATVVLLALLRAFPDVWLWFPLRFALGMAASFLWIAGEAWVNHAATETHRGRIIAIFGIVVSGGFALGPLILSMTGTEGWAPFLVTMPCSSWRRRCSQAPSARPRSSGERPARSSRYVLLAPVAMFGYFVFAAGDAMLLTFLPIYAAGLGVEEVDAIRLLTVLAVGSMALQYPIGWLADRVSNYAIAAAMGAVLLAGSAALPWALPLPAISIVFMFFYGGALGALYTISLVLLGRRFKGADLSAASAMLAVMFCLGSFIWPSAGGAALDRFGGDAMPVSLIAAYACSWSSSSRHGFAAHRREGEPERWPGRDCSRRPESEPRRRGRISILDAQQGHGGGRTALATRWTCYADLSWSPIGRLRMRLPVAL